MKLTHLSLLALACAALPAAVRAGVDINISVPAPEIVIRTAPPRERVEVVPAAPGPDYFWIGGHWQWTDHWVWVGGRYDRHPHFHPGGGWEPGRWEQHDGRYTWREGHWR
jgi:hypothetical protein